MTPIPGTVPNVELEGSISTVGGVPVVALAGLVDLAAERTRLQKEIDNIDKQLQRIHGLLGNASFVEKAKPEVIERERNKQDELQDQRSQLAERLASLAE